MHITVGSGMNQTAKIRLGMVHFNDDTRARGPLFTCMKRYTAQSKVSVRMGQE